MTAPVGYNERKQAALLLANLGPSANSFVELVAAALAQARAEGVAEGAAREAVMRSALLATDDLYALGWRERHAQAGDPTNMAAGANETAEMLAIRDKVRAALSAPSSRARDLLAVVDVGRALVNTAHEVTLCVTEPPCGNCTACRFVAALAKLYGGSDAR